MSLFGLSPLKGICFFIVVVFSCVNCQTLQQGQTCKSTCPGVLRGQRHSYRYSTVVGNVVKGPSLGSSLLALDCVVEIDVRPGCSEMILKLRNIQIKQSSSRKDNSVVRIKNIRESLEKNPLRFWLEKGKVTKLCPQEGEQVWSLNMKRALLSMIQTSDSDRARETVTEMDVYGTCTSTYEQNGNLLTKTRNLQKCLSDRISRSWKHSVPLKDATTVGASLTCNQIHGVKVMKMVNCTEIVSMLPIFNLLKATETKTFSSLTLLRSLEVTPVSLAHSTSYYASIEFEAEMKISGRHGGSSVEEVSSTLRRLCAHLTDLQQHSELHLNLVLQLRSLSLQQLRNLGPDAFFKCRDDWQPIMETLSSCGTEECILFIVDLIQKKQIDQEHVLPLLSTMSFATHSSPSMINRLSTLLQVPLIRQKALLVVSSLIHNFCRQETRPCTEVSEVQDFIQFLQQSLKASCAVDDQFRITELLHVFKAVENAGLAVFELIPELNRWFQDQTAPLELRLAAVRAFRRIPCRHDRKAIFWAYQRQQENVEVRIAAYQQLMHCPNPETFRIVKLTLANEKSSQVGSYVWSHLLNILKTEDPLKIELMESLPDDIVSKDFEAELWKYSSHVDYTVDMGVAAANMEGAVVFSPESFIPRYATANLTVYILGRAFNVLEIGFRMENADSFLKKMFEDHVLSPANHSRHENVSESMQHDKNQDNISTQTETGNCQKNLLPSMKNEFTRRRRLPGTFRCWMNVKMFGSDLTLMSCDELYTQQRKLSLSAAAVAVKLLKGQEIKITQRPVVFAEELVLPSLSGLPMRLSMNISTVISLRMKGNANFKSVSHFSLAGYIKPNALVSVSLRAGVDGAFGRVGLEWMTELKTFTNLDGGIYLHRGQSLKVALNTPEDVMEVVTFNSRMFRVSGDHKEELLAVRNLRERNTCTPKSWSKMLGWQLCSDVTYPSELFGTDFSPLGPILFTLRLQKLDKALNQYLLEATYTFVPQRNSWIPLKGTLLLFVGTPQSIIPRDVSLDLNLSTKKIILKLIHPLKTILIQGEIEEIGKHFSGRIELLIDNTHHYFIKGLMETMNLASETRTHFHLDAKVVADGHPFSLSVNTTHARSRKIFIQALLKNVFSKDASLSVQLERSLEGGHRHYSVDAGFLLPSAVSFRALGFVKQSSSEWSSAVRTQYSLQGDTQDIRECHMTQNLLSELLSVQTYRVTLAQQLHCSHFSSVNHEIHFKHERSPVNVQSLLDISYGKLWNQSNNKRRILFSQLIRNQSQHNLTSYAIELSLQLPDKGLNYRIQLLHSSFKGQRSESNTRLKINHNSQMLLVAGVHWKDVSTKTLIKKWEGSFNIDTPVLYLYVAQKLSQPQRGVTQFSSEIVARKLLNIYSVTLEGFYKDRGKERQGQLNLFSPSVRYIKVDGRSVMGKRGVKASYSVSTPWTPAINGQISIGNSKQVKTLDISAGFGKKDLNISAVLSSMDKKLKKRILLMTVTLSHLKNLYAELHVEGAVEELKRERTVYQKRWKLAFRQLFKFLPQSLVLQETFTCDLQQKSYLLESKVLLNGNKKANHVLTLGYKPQHPFVCSSMLQSFNTQQIPQDSRFCITIQNNQTFHEIQGRFWAGKEEKLIAFGQLQLYNLNSSLHGFTLKSNLTQLFLVEMPEFLGLNVELLGNQKSVSEFLFHSEAKLDIDEKIYAAHASLAQSPLRKLNTSITLVEDDKNATLHLIAQSVEQKDLKSVSVQTSFHQCLFAGVTSDARIYLTANTSSQSVFLQCTVEKQDQSLAARLRVTARDNPESQISLSGNLTNWMADLTALPKTASLAGTLTRSEVLTIGDLTLRVDDAVYGLEAAHHHEVNTSEDLSGAQQAPPCFPAVEPSQCLNIRGRLARNGCRPAGLLSNSSSDSPVNWTEGLCGQVDLQIGSRSIRFTLQQIQLQVNCSERTNTDHLPGICAGRKREDSLKDGIGGDPAISLHLQGHTSSSSTGLMVNISHNISALEGFLPPVFLTESEINSSQASVKASTRLLLDSEHLWMDTEVSNTSSVFKQALSFNHSIHQLLDFFPSSLTVKTLYHWRKQSQAVWHQTQWETSPEQRGDPHGWALDFRIEQEVQRKLAELRIDWSMFGSQEQLRLHSSRTLASRQTKPADPTQRFISSLAQLHLHAQSNKPSRDLQGRRSWVRGKPLNVSVTVSEHWHLQDSSRGQACVFLSPGPLPLVEMEGCVAVAQDVKTYSQNAEFKWKDKSLTQSMKYQEAVKGMHTLLVEFGAHNISPQPCPSHSLLSQIHTNLRNRLEHHVQLGLCPPQPVLIWSGSHQVNSGKNLLSARMGLSAAGHDPHNSFTLSIRNISSRQRSNYSLLTEWQIGNWSVELAGSALSSGRNASVRVHARLDRSEMLWLQGSLGKQCLQASVGFENETSDDIRTVFCLGGRNWFTMEAQRGGSDIENEILAHISVGAVKQSLRFQAKGGRECLWATEARLQQLGSRIRRKLLDRVQRIQYLLFSFRRQMLPFIKTGHASFLQELSEGPLSLIQWTETLLSQRAGAAWMAWTTGPFRHALTQGLPHTLQLLHLTSLQFQQELRKPLATLAGAYHDVTGERLESVWQQAVKLWTKELSQLLPAVLHHPQLRAPSLVALQIATFATDMVNQHTSQWLETRLAAMLVGVKRQLVLMYKFSRSEGEVIFRLPLLVKPWMKVKEAGVPKILVEEFVLKPLLALNSMSPTAELYQLKRKMMDGPINYEAFLVADQFLVTFDGLLFRIPASCNYILAADVSKHSFCIGLKYTGFPRRSVIVQIQNTTVAMHSNGEVEVNCQRIQKPYANHEVSIWRDVNLILVSNERGVSISCDPDLKVCSVILDRWLHGVSSGLLGTNDNEEVNELSLPNGLSALSTNHFTHGWQVDSGCLSRKAGVCQNATGNVPQCTFLFSSFNSPLSPCFKVVDPVQFVEMCEESECEHADGPDVSRSALCMLASAYIHLCHRNYVPLELPVQCVRYG